MSKQEAIKDLTEIIERATRLLEAAKMLPELPDYCYLWATGTKLRIRIPYDFSLLADLDQIFLQETTFVKQDSWWSPDGDNNVNYKNDDGIGILVTMTGSKCQLKKIGEKIEPIYRPVDC